MAALNENLILKVFAEMSKNKPSPSKHLPEKDEDEEINYSIISHLLIKNFPRPVSVELRHIFSGTMRRPGRTRLDQIFKTVERTIQFVSFVLVCQAWYDITNKIID
jgi:uncharacterized UBP type Zn finger protein